MCKGNPLTPERQWSNQTRERTIERAEEPPTQRPRLEDPASSIRWSRVDDAGHWVPATTVEDEEDMWTETDREVLWQQQVDDHIWKNNGQPACLCQEEWDELFSNTCENVTAHVCFCRSEFTGLTATRMTRGDELITSTESKLTQRALRNTLMTENGTDKLDNELITTLFKNITTLAQLHQFTRAEETTKDRPHNQKKRHITQ